MAFIGNVDSHENQVLKNIGNECTRIYRFGYSHLSAAIVLAMLIFCCDSGASGVNSHIDLSAPNLLVSELADW